jgi:hypothetical protein
MRRTGLAIRVAVAALAVTVAAGPGPVAGDAKGKAKPSPKAAAQNSCKPCKERRPTLDPARFAKGFEPEVAPAYEVARKYPETLDRLHCFCECQESPVFRHKTLLTCFTDEHAAGCGICLKEALMAADLKGRGASDEEVELTVESVFKTDGHPPTHGHGQ